MVALRKIVITTLISMSLAYLLYLHTQSGIKTNRAYVGGDAVQLYAEIDAPGLSLHAEVNQTVGRGDILWQTDSRESQYDTERLHYAVREKQAQIDELEHRIREHDLFTAAKHVTLEQLRATRDWHQQQLRRLEEMHRRNLAVLADVESAQHVAYDSTLTLSREEHLLRQHEAGRAVLLSQLQQLTLQQQQLSAALSQQQLVEEKHVMRAPVPGIIVALHKQPGEPIFKGERVLTLIDNTRIWVDAYFKESDSAALRVGRQATITLDSHPGQTFAAQIDSVAPVAGAKLSPLSPNYTSSTFTRVAQRIPVRLRFTSVSHSPVLRPGVSATVELIND